MEEKISVIEWHVQGSDEGPLVFRLDAPDSGNDLFQCLHYNAEMDGRDKLVIKEITQKEWDQIEKNSEEATV